MHQGRIDRFIEVFVDKLNMHYDMFAADAQFVWRLAAAVRELRVLDHLPDTPDLPGKVHTACTHTHTHAHACTSAHTSLKVHACLCGCMAPRCCGA